MVWMMYSTTDQLAGFRVKDARFPVESSDDMESASSLGVGSGAKRDRSGPENPPQAESSVLYRSAQSTVTVSVKDGEHDGGDDPRGLVTVTHCSNTHFSSTGKTHGPLEKYVSNYTEHETSIVAVSYLQTSEKPLPLIASRVAE
ncbi:hypothetical protein EYF80_055308 [Liparis tanakae]|uniref:Uncharacterized protein n=1 Tax=Liparis tanakae TaxID=230148 RepID=A0A4Z2EZW1_9TELE|nr:hypothetical protein EYF80_055308 [Liparis tanakae]